MIDQDQYVRGIIMIASTVVVLLAASMMLVVIGCHRAHAHEHSRPDLNAWFDKLQSAKGLCCSRMDGTALADVDWESIAGHYRVRIEGKWWNVPDDAVIKEPNLVGVTMVWPMFKREGDELLDVAIRCFMPGSMT